MNRQQRRTRVKLSREEWAMRMTELRKTMPQGLDDLGMGQLLMEIIVNEQLNISHESLATLVGVACVCMDRVWKSLPKATHVDKDGNPVYSVEQIAAFTGQTAEQVQSGITQFAQATGQTLVAAADIEPLH